MTRDVWYRVLPFALFMGFIGLQQGLEYLRTKGFLALTNQDLLYLYPIKAIAVGLLLLLFRRHYRELKWADLAEWKTTAGTVLLGLLVFFLWINMDWDFASLGENPGFDPSLISGEGTRNLLIIFRLIGAALVVPIMEELFWRSFLLRYIIDSDFTKVQVGRFTWGSFAISAVLFGLEHHLLLAGIMAGVAYNLLLYKTKSISQCILCHAVTNLALGIYVLQTSSWRFW